MTRDARLLFLARAVRMFGYGALGVILVLYLAAAGPRRPARSGSC